MKTDQVSLGPTSCSRTAFELHGVAVKPPCAMSSQLIEIMEVLFVCLYCFLKRRV